MLLPKLKQLRLILFANSEFTGADWGYENFKGYFLGRIDAWYLSRNVGGQCKTYLKMRIFFLII